PAVTREERLAPRTRGVRRVHGAATGSGGTPPARGASRRGAGGTAPLGHRSRGHPGPRRGADPGLPAAAPGPAAWIPAAAGAAAGAPPAAGASPGVPASAGPPPAGPARTVRAPARRLPAPARPARRPPRTPGRPAPLTRRPSSRRDRRGERYCPYPRTRARPPVTGGRDGAGWWGD